jgi:tryptophanyl-tRNA synthetase
LSAASKTAAPLRVTPESTETMPEPAISSSRPRVLSGMRPTGKLHLGNYMGALANWVKLQDQYECYFFIADWHALTTDYADPSRLKLNTLDVALDWLAAGLDPEKSTIFIQSHVPQHAELHLLFSMITPLGWLERVPSYKEQQENIKGKDLTTYGFLGYPLLQAADILMYQAQFVPVGQDQVAHVELTREVARRFNSLYPKRYGPKNMTELSAEEAQSDSLRGSPFEAGTPVLELGRLDSVFLEPESLLTPSPKLPGTDGRKMSKSYGNTIGLTEDPKSVAQKIEAMSTNGQRPRQTDSGDPDQCPVGDLHKVFSLPDVITETQVGCRTASVGCKDCKALCAKSVSEHFAPIRAKRRELERDVDSVWELLRIGSKNAASNAELTMKDVRRVLGVSRDIDDLGEKFAGPTDLEIPSDADFFNWSNVDYVINSHHQWRECVPQFQIHWWRKMVPRDIALKRPTQNFESEERRLEEPFMTASGKRVLVTVSNSGPDSAPTPQGLVKTWHFDIPQRSYEAWTLLLYEGDAVPTKFANATGMLSAFVVPQKFYTRDFALAKKSSKESDKISVKIMKNQSNHFLLGFELFGRLEDITDLQSNYAPLR